MAFFNFNKPADNNADNNSNSIKVAGKQQDIVLMFNDDSITISAADAAGKTVEQLFEEFGGDLGDTDRINRYVAAGTVIAADAPVNPGTVYRGVVTSESKGRI